MDERRRSIDTGEGEVPWKTTSQQDCEPCVMLGHGEAASEPIGDGRIERRPGPVSRCRLEVCAEGRRNGRAGR